MTLTVADHMTLRLAAAPYRYPAARESDVHHHLGMTAPVFWRHVDRLLDRPEVLAAYPTDVRRLQRIRASRRRARSSNRLAS